MLDKETLSAIAIVATLTIVTIYIISGWFTKERR